LANDDIKKMSTTGNRNHQRFHPKLDDRKEKREVAMWRNPEQNGRGKEERPESNDSQMERNG